MLTFPQTMYVSTRATDMRKSIDGLCGEVHNFLEKPSTCGSLFVFFNHSRDKIKLLFWDSDGYWVLYKRLERGTFQLPKFDAGTTQISLDARTLHCILSGIDLTSVRTRKRLNSHR